MYLDELNLTIGTRETIDMALLFLYGKKCPKLTSENIYHMFDLAEFLMIPNLKSFCCKWIHRVDINDDNVETFLHISSLFDFELTTLTRYIRQHLDILFAGDRLLSLTAESLEFLITDQTLSYVTSDQRLLFILKWAQHSLKERSAFLEEMSLLKMLDVTEITHKALAKAKHMESYRDIESFIYYENVYLAENRKVLVTLIDWDPTRLLLYDIDRKQWFAVRLENPMLDCSSWVKIQAYSNKSSVMIIQKSFFQGKDTTVVDLADKKTEKTVFVNSQCSQETFLSSDLALGGGDCYGKKVVEFKYTEIYAGKILPSGNDNKTSLSPLLAFKETGEMDIVANGEKLIAARGKTKPACIYIYDVIECQMTKLLLKTNYYTDTIASFHDGFVVYNDSKILRIAHIKNNQDSVVLKKMQVFETSLKVGYGSKLEYISKGNMWIRFPRHMSEEGNIEFTHADLGVIHPDDADWRSVAWPERYKSVEMARAIQEMVVPYSAQKCNLECPHCDRFVEEQRKKDENERVYYYDHDMARVLKMVSQLKPK